MVEFGLKLAENMVERWRQFYIDYKGLKKLLKRLRAQGTGATLSSAWQWMRFRNSRAHAIASAGEKAPLLEASTAATYGTEGGGAPPAAMPERVVGHEGWTHPSEQFEAALLEQVQRVEMFYQSELRTLAEDFHKLCEVFHCTHRYKASNYFATMDPEATPDDADYAMQVGAQASRKLRATSFASSEENSGVQSERSAQLQKLSDGFNSSGGGGGGGESSDRELPTSPFRRLSREFSISGMRSDEEKDRSEREYSIEDDDPSIPLGERRRRRRNTRQQAKMILACSEEVQSGIQQIISDCTREMWLLQNFCILNYTACVKIVKKHDKAFPESKLHSRMMRAIEAKSFHRHAGIDKLISDIEGLVADLFCEGNRGHARGMLLTKRGVSKPDWAMLHLGYRMGVAAVLFVWVIQDCAVQVLHRQGQTVFTLPAFPVFRAVGGLLLLHWAWGLSVLTWTRARINYIYLFDFDPRRILKPREIFASATSETIWYFLTLLLYYKVKFGEFPNYIPAGYYPLALTVYAAYRLFHPWALKRKLWKTLGRCIYAPCGSVTFYDSFVADVLTSLVKVFQDVAWTLCYFVSFQFQHDSEEDLQTSSIYQRVVIPVICILPLWIRFQQCLRRFYDTKRRWPHLANGLKYALSQAVSLFGALYPLYNLTLQRGHGDRIDAYLSFWLCVFILSAVYSFFWDVFVDWNFGRPQYAFLSDPGKLMFSRRWFYYVSIVVDLFLRFSWLVTLIPPNEDHKFVLFVPAYLGPITMVAEICRRTMWSMFRLENEHQRNTSGFRRVHFVPLLFEGEKKASGEHVPTYTGRRVLLEVLMVFAGVIAVLVSTALLQVRRYAPTATDDDY